MDPAVLVESATPSLALLFVAAFLSVIASLSLGALLVSRVPVHPLLAGLATGPLGLVLVALNQWSATAADPGDLGGSRVAVAGGVLVLLVTPFFAVVPSFLHLVMALGGALRDAPRRLLWILAGLLPLAAVVGLPVLGGYVVGNGFFEIAFLRVVPYAVLALLALPALAGGPARHASASSASAGLALVTFVGLSEASLRGAFYFLMLGRFSTLEDPVAREAFVLNARADLLAPVGPWVWGAFAAAAVFAVLAFVPVFRGEGPWHRALGLLWVPVAAVPLLVCDVPMSAWTALATALGGG